MSGIVVTIVLWAIVAGVMASFAGALGLTLSFPIMFLFGLYLISTDARLF